MPALQFLHAHATHPQGALALELVWAQLASKGAERMGATLGWVYLTDALAPESAIILAGLRERLPGVAWVGASGSGVLSSGVEYHHEPALAIMVCNLPASEFQLFHGRHPLPHPRNAAYTSPNRPHTALVHASAYTPELNELLSELGERTHTGFLFGGMPSSRGVHIAMEAHAPHGHAPEGGLWREGLSGVALGAGVRQVCRVSQGCEPVGPSRRVTAAERNIIYELDGQPALSCLLHDLGIQHTPRTADWPREALPKMRATLVGLSGPDTPLMAHGLHLGPDARVRHLIGLDPSRQGVAIGEAVMPEMQLAFCHQDAQAARRDLIRMCAEIREEFAPGDAPQAEMAGALYISCAGRGGEHFGGAHAEMAIIAHALGDIPLVGFFASAEIAHQHVYGYSGVLTVFGR